VKNYEYGVDTRNSGAQKFWKPGTSPRHGDKEERKKEKKKKETRENEGIEERKIEGRKGRKSNTENETQQLGRDTRQTKTRQDPPGCKYFLDPLRKPDIQI
jgi:hypothetical protein